MLLSVVFGVPALISFILFTVLKPPGYASLPDFSATLDPLRRFQHTVSGSFQRLLPAALHVDTDKIASNGHVQAIVRRLQSLFGPLHRVVPAKLSPATPDAPAYKQSHNPEQSLDLWIPALLLLTLLSMRRIPAFAKPAMTFLSGVLVTLWTYIFFRGPLRQLFGNTTFPYTTPQDRLRAACMPNWALDTLRSYVHLDLDHTVPAAGCDLISAHIFVLAVLVFVGIFSVWWPDLLF
ncbi:hypothetical protein B0H11DRAFT_2294844 [Mycena galericulata]|nr:hypothetical protein B0H11DRAFT_2294844 [Mycena galericulata]